MENKTDTFDIDQLDSADTADMTVLAFGKPTSWIWTFAGPGHPKAIAQADRTAREALVTEKLQEQSRVNGRKWKAPEETPDERRGKNVTWIVERIVGWTPVKFGGKDFPFTEENARRLLSDRRKPDLYNQALEFLNADLTFMKRSANG